jgi:Fic family protein
MQRWKHRGRQRQHQHEDRGKRQHQRVKGAHIEQERPTMSRHSARTAKAWAWYLRPLHLFETPGWMKDLVEWFSQSIQEESQHPLILIGIFIVVFLAIHPFKDGNGRLLRVLTTLLLLRAGYGYMPYSSMETVIEANKDSYYLALRRTQQTIRKEEQSWEPWLVFFFKTMAKQKDNVASRVKDEQAFARPCPRSRVRYWSSRRRAAKLPSRKSRIRPARTATPSRCI